MKKTEEGTGEGESQGTGERAQPMWAGERQRSGGLAGGQGERDKREGQGEWAPEEPEEGPAEGRAGPDCQPTCSCLRSRVLGNGRELQVQFFSKSDSSWKARAEVSPQPEDWRLDHCRGGTGGPLTGGGQINFQKDGSGISMAGAHESARRRRAGENPLQEGGREPSEGGCTHRPQGV